MPTQLIDLAQIRTDGGTQMRATIDQPTVADYILLIDQHAGAWPPSLPPIDLYYDGETHWLADGFHRVAAARLSNKLAAVPANITPGTRRDAILHAAAANATHGLRRTNADKRRAVETLLKDTEWSAWSDGEIAKRCQVSQPFVSNLRKELATHNHYESPTTRTGADGRTTNTANIGLRPPQPFSDKNPRLELEYDRLVRTKGFGMRSGDGTYTVMTPDPAQPRLGPFTNRNTALQAALDSERTMAPFVTAQELEEILTDLGASPADLTKNGTYKYGPTWDAALQRVKDLGRPFLLSHIGDALVRIANRPPAIVATPPAAVGAIPNRTSDPPPFPVSAPPGDARTDELMRIYAYLNATCDQLERFAVLTGKHTLILAPRRELSAIMTTIDAELSALNHD